ncbi:hypothetical protein CMV_026069 [Castanea mollissima]|uniref:FBD domain-containing protein n=1 Tax=Castanea mollissima TaxID=60419 RepID=A0A8J4QI97_9ROSI|nr:hypothetical protein CMV_026069 [Castanea mollissima]
MANSSKSKRQKLNCREETVGADRISDLPDCLLIHILSLLRTKQAIQTSRLSSRWKLLWTYVPKLNLDIDSFPKFECDKVASIINFECYVFKVLAKHKAKYLRNFRLKYNLNHQKCLDRWISTLTTSALNLQELDLQIINCPTPTDCCWKLPHSIFYCNKLVVLKIEGHIVLDPSSSSSFQLNTLKILRLESITFANRDSLVTLLSFCPVLEDLTLKIYDYKEFKFKICVPTLIRLSVSYLNKKLEIDTPSLEYFDFECQRSYGLICPTRFQNLVCLVFKYNGHNLSVLEALLLRAPNLRVVLVDKIAKGRTQKLYWTEPPNDPNSLLSHLTTFYFRGYKGLKHEVDFVKFILKEARVLTAMRIEVHHHSKLKKSVFEELSIFPRRSSTCLLSVKYGYGFDISL